MASVNRTSAFKQACYNSELSYDVKIKGSKWKHSKESTCYFELIDKKLKKGQCSGTFVKSGKLLIKGTEERYKLTVRLIPIKNESEKENATLLDSSQYRVIGTLTQLTHIKGFVPKTYIPMPKADGTHAKLKGTMEQIKESEIYRMELKVKFPKS